MSKETTFSQDLPAGPELRRALAELAGNVARSALSRELFGRTLTLKLRLSDFSILTRRRTLPEAPKSADEYAAVATSLLNAATTELAAGSKYRLVGLGVSNFAVIAPHAASVGSDFLE